MYNHGLPTRKHSETQMNKAAFSKPIVILKPWSSEESSRIRAAGLPPQRPSPAAVCRRKRRDAAWWRPFRERRCRFGRGMPVCSRPGGDAFLTHHSLLKRELSWLYECTTENRKRTLSACTAALLFCDVAIPSAKEMRETATDVHSADPDDSEILQTIDSFILHPLIPS